MKTDPMKETFVGEAIKPEGISFCTSPMAAGKPGLPVSFSWRGKRYAILEVLKECSDLKVVNYVAPEYPDRALERGVEGWVDIEFTVATDGTTRDVTVADASTPTYFRREAVAAVEQWRFEPRVFMGRTIEQRSYTRIRFVQ